MSGMVSEGRPALFKSSTRILARRESDRFFRSKNRVEPLIIKIGFGFCVSMQNVIMFKR